MVAPEWQITVWFMSTTMRSTRVATKRSHRERHFRCGSEAIGEVADIVRYIVNSLNGNYVVITADHGFLFTETAPG